MRSALLMFGYALAVAWCLPAPLTRLTARGVSARLGLAAWLTAMISALASTAIALQFLIRVAIGGWPGLAEAVCRSVAGAACAPTVYRSAIFELALGAATVFAAVTVAVAVWRYGRGVQRAKQRTHAHAAAARITGTKLRDAVVRDARSLAEVLPRALRAYPNGVLVEEFVPGIDVTVPFLEGRGDEGVLLPVDYVVDPPARSRPLRPWCPGHPAGQGQHVNGQPRRGLQRP